METLRHGSRGAEKTALEELPVETANTWAASANSPTTIRISWTERFYYYAIKEL